MSCVRGTKDNKNKHVLFAIAHVHELIKKKKIGQKKKTEIIILVHIQYSPAVYSAVSET